MRVEILKKKIVSQNKNDKLNDDIIAYIANNCDSDVRQLESALTRIFAYSAMFNINEISLEIAIEALKGFLSKSSYIKNNIQRIQQVVAEYYNITVQDMKSKKRNANIAFPRHVAVYLCRTMTDESLPKIGIQFGGRDHTTIMNSVERIEEELKENSNLQKIVESIKSKLQ